MDRNQQKSSGIVNKEEQFSRFLSLLKKVSNYDDFYKRFYTQVDVDKIKSHSDLTLIPFLSKDELNQLQEISPPFGGIMNNDIHHSDYLFLTPGAKCEPGYLDDDFWRTSRALIAADFNSNDVIHNTFSYHLTPGGWMFDAGARSIGCTIIPAGTSPLDMQVQAIMRYKPSAYCGTPDFLMRIAQYYQKKYGEQIPIRKALLSGSVLTVSLINFFKALKISFKQCYATAELGIIAYEIDGHEGMYVDQDVFLEIINPDTGDQVIDGQPGEVVVTTLRNNYPLMRYCTGDISEYVQPSLNRNHQVSIKGVLGRVDDSTKVKGMFIRTRQIKALLNECPYIVMARLLVDRTNDRDHAILHCELDEKTNLGNTEDIKKEILNLFRSICHIGCSISIVPNGTIPIDGKLIVDLRNWSSHLDKVSGNETC